MELEDNFKKNVKKKLIETLLSVKVWCLLGILTTSSVFLAIDKLTGTQWATMNGSVISTIMAVREAFKVAKIRTPDTVIGKERDIII